MSLISRIISPGPLEESISAHAFTGAMGEYKRGAPNVTLAAITTEFNLNSEEQADLATLAALYVSDHITREQLHDCLFLGSEGIYDEADVESRLLTASAPDLTLVLMLAKIEAIRIGLYDFTLSGCAVTPQGTPDMTLAVAKGSVLTSAVLHAVTAGNVTIAAAHAELSRLDLVVADSSGAKQVRQGTVSAKPALPTISSGDVPLALVYVPPGTTAIDAGKMMDVRVSRSVGPVVIGQITTPVVRSNTSAQQVFIDLSMPSGLFLTGRKVRVRCGGTMLLNSGTPTVTLAIAYGGSIMFQDVTGAATSDADRLAWFLEFELCAQGTSDQVLVGSLTMSPLAAKTAPNTGVGDIAGTASPVNPISGSATVNSDTGDRALQMAWTMSVANANDEIAMEYATAELM